MLNDVVRVSGSTVEDRDVLLVSLYIVDGAGETVPGEIIHWINVGSRPGDIPRIFSGL